MRPPIDPIFFSAFLTGFAQISRIVCGPAGGSGSLDPPASYVPDLINRFFVNGKTETDGGISLSLL